MSSRLALVALTLEILDTSGLPRRLRVSSKDHVGRERTALGHLSSGGIPHLHSIGASGQQRSECYHGQQGGGAAKIEHGFPKKPAYKHGHQSCGGLFHGSWKPGPSESPPPGPVERPPPGPVDRPPPGPVERPPPGPVDKPPPGPVESPPPGPHERGPPGPA